MLVGVPVAFSIGLASLLYLTFYGDFPLEILVQRSISGVNSFPLLALPLFILAGYLMELGATDRLIRLADSLLGWMRGGLAAVSVAASGLFGAVSGSGVATIAAIGSILQPAMIKRGYAPGFTVAVQGTAGNLGILIPPSITMVIFAVAGNIPVGQALIAGLIPGIIVTIVIALSAVLASRRYGFRSEGVQFDPRATGAALVKAIPPLLLPAIVVGGIMGGVFTATEGASVAVLYALVLAFAYRDVSVSKLKTALYKSVRTSAIILSIIAFSAAFAWLITINQIPTRLADWLSEIAGGSGVLIIALLMVALIIVGMFMETTAIILITTPVFLPVAVSAGLDPLVYAVMMTVMLMIGAVTPPLAVGLFTAASVVDVKPEPAFRYVGWFIVPLLLLGVLFWVVPDVTTVLVE